jgi:hypothetical protein
VAALAVEIAGRLVGQQDGGSVTMARAMATRCCWPPDSSAGVWCSHCRKPTASSAARALAWRAARGSRRDRERQFDVFQRGGAGQQVETLEHEAEVMPAQQSALVAGQLLDVRCRESR